MQGDGYTVTHYNFSNAASATRRAELNNGSHRCEFRPRGRGGAQCRNMNGLFRLDMTGYSHLQHAPPGAPATDAFSATEIAAFIASGHLLAAAGNGVHDFCWQHAERLTGLRVKDAGALGKGLFTTRAFRDNEQIALFSLKRTTQAAIDALYDGSGPPPGSFNTVPYGLNTNIAGHARISDDWANRGLADYANDIRGNVGTARTRPQCTGAQGLRTPGCAAVDPTQGDVAENCDLIERRIGTGAQSDKEILTISNPGGVAGNVQLRWDYGEPYWEGSYCPTAENPGQLCNKITR